MTKGLNRKIIRMLFLTAGTWILCAGQASAAPEVGLSGDQARGFLTADNDGRYQFVNVPLRRNAVNKFTVTARDGDQIQTREVSITQISLESVVVSKIKSTPLTVQQIEQLVSDGVIDIDDPANFNVSVFQIVLTIGGREVPINVPMVRGIQEPMVEESIPPASDPGDGRNSNPNPPEVVIFEVFPKGIAGEPPPPPIPGVLIIEGRIKTLKEFYSVRLLLMNTSGIFTLHDVVADIEFPDGGLSRTLPEDGIVQFGDILPGDGEVPGQKEREFIIRGDEIGVRKVKVNFGGTIIGGGIPEEEIIPFNGSAETTVEVKGPPEFRVQVIHPPAVVAGIPYELIVDIQNIGDTPALYTSFELDVGADGELVECVIDENTLQPVCVPIEGSAVRNIGHLLAGDKTRQSFMINPFATGPITSCIAVADQNIDLQVHVGNLGCVVGERSVAKSPDGVPTMSVLPAANAFGVGIDSPVVAIFNEKMNESTISIGAAGTIKVFDAAGNLVPGELRVVPLGDHTAAIFQVKDNITNRWTGNSTYTIEISDQIFDLQGVQLETPWTSVFTTTDPNNDLTPPSLTLSVEPPVNPSQVLPGQVIRFNAYASDQGSHVSRVELRKMDSDMPESVFELIDQKTVFADQSEAIIFSVDSANLEPGHTYQFKATAFDNAGNSQETTLPVIMAPSVAPPTIVLPADPVDPVLYGISVSLMPETLSAAANRVDYFLDADSDPFATVTLAPYSVTLNTLGLTTGVHTIRAMATDGLGQTGQDTFSFELVENPNEPVVDFGGALDGQQYVTGASLFVNGNASDPTGIQSVAFFFDDPFTAPIATSAEPFVLNTEGLPLGDHKLYIQATNKAGVSNNLNAPASFLEFSVLSEPPAAPPPAAPQVTNITFPVNGLVTVTGSSVANARLDITNRSQGLEFSVFANEAGAFQFTIAAEAGDQISLTAFNLAQSSLGSAPTQVVVPDAPVLDHITVDPAAKTFNAANQFQDIAVTGHYEGGDTADLTSQAAFSSSDPSVASVNAAGRIAGLANGSAVITVTVGGKQAQVNITVDIVTLESIALTPSDFTIYGISNTQQLAIMGTYSNGTTSPIPAGNVAFVSSSIGVAMINSNGLVTSIGLGEAVITAAVTGLPPAQALVKVEAVSASGISVSPNAVLFTEEDETRQLDVTVSYTDGTTSAPTGLVEYESSDDTVATVTASGLITSVADGDATVTVSTEGFDATVTIVVDIPDVVLPPPEILSLDRIKAAEGDTLTLIGKNFSPLPAENLVMIGGVQASVISARQDELSVIVPRETQEGAGVEVTVQVDDRLSNIIELFIYPRIAKAYIITPAIDMPSAETTIPLPGPELYVHTNDGFYLSSAPGALAPLDFEGGLFISVDGAPFTEIVNSGGEALLINGFFTPGNLSTIQFELRSTTGEFKTAPIWLIAGPEGTGPLGGIQSVMANAQSRPTPVTLQDLTALDGSPYPDGAKVVVTAQAHCFRDRVTSACIGSHGGSITGAEGSSPDGLGLQIFTVQNGRVDVIYDPVSAPPLDARESAVANIQVMPANASGQRTSSTALAVAPVTLTSFDTVGTPRNQTSTVADGLEKIVTISFTGARDTAGQPVPDGTPFLVTVQAHCFRNPQDSSCIPSAGGSMLSGTASPDGFGLAQHFIQNGSAEIQYSPGTLALSFPDTATANLQFLPSRPNGSRIGSRAFQITPVLLSSLTSPELDFDTSVFADGGDNRMIVTLSNFKDASGSPVPDGTKIVVTAQAHCFRDPVTNGCIGSVGGVIKSGVPSPDGFGFQIHEIQGGEAEVVYSSEGVAMQTRSSGEVAVQILPATPNGNRIGSRAFAVARFNAVGVQASVVSASPSAVVADNNSKTVNISLTNIRDVAGNVVPDGTSVVLTPQAHCFRNPDDSSCIPSLGGVVTSGTVSPEGYGFKVHTVSGGQVQATYDPDSVTLAFPDVGVANIQVLPAMPSGNRIGNYAFSIVPVTLSSLQQTQVTVNPASLLADQNAANVTTIILTDIKDGAGNNVPDGTKIVATPQAHCFRDPVTNGCVPSAGGTVTSGTPGPEGYGFQVHTISGGSVQMTFASAPVLVESRQAAVANVQILPAQGNGSRVGNRAFALAAVTLAGYQSADISGPGQLAPNGAGTYLVTNIRDTSGNLVPDGSKIAVTPQAHCFRDPDTNGCVGSVGGVVTNGAATPEGFGFKIFTVSAGQISVDYQAPTGTGTAVLQLLPAMPSGARIGNRAFAVKSVSVQS